jgi:transposase
MIQLLPQLNILLAYQPVDFRKGIDGLIGLCRAQFDAELYDGTLFVFRNRRGTALKILAFDGVGWWLYNGLPEQASFVSPWRALRPAQAASASASAASPL